MVSLREKKKRKTREAILNAAIELFGKNGFEATSISQLAQKAGVGKGTVYSYFSTKQDILNAFCEGELEYVHEQLNTKTNPDAPVLEQLVTIFLAEFEYVTRTPEFGRLYMQEMLFPKKEMVLNHKELENKFLDMIFPIISRAQQRGELRADMELLHLCGHFFSLFILLVHAWYSDLLGDQTAEEALTTLFSNALNGLQPPGTSIER
ncbi:TetR/AcrR family transcriptional regulator [Desulfosediminicola ganghwensis]|uniref:TetR/AcrR family transcriptional regulator n=1 Tax=Desulfosediminicola ganghwensis TaxID=2569540 RepID=UPI0010AD7938|nr:TetR/AcrR family transcriptional regulator [Desulfosediminicola ganghwensis]